MITTIKRYAALVGTVCVALLALVLYLRVRYGRPSMPIVSAPVTVLPQADKEQILVDPVKHTLIIVKPTGNTVLTLPDHPSTIDIRKDGSVNVTSPQYGWENRFFVGFQASDHVRVAVGADLFYFKRLDVGIGGAAQVGVHEPIGVVKLSYNFWSNCQIGIDYGTDRHVGGLLTVRL